MPSKKDTPEEDFRRFEKYIEDMPDMEFEEKLEISQEQGGFSEKQKRLFSEMRESIDEDKAEILLEHGFNIDVESQDDEIKKYRDPLRNFYSKWQK